MNQQYRTFILTPPNRIKRVMLLSKSARLTFKNLIAKRGYDKKVADELWKWYDASEKKGVASF